MPMSAQAFNEDAVNRAPVGNPSGGEFDKSGQKKSSPAASKRQSSKRRKPTLPAKRATGKAAAKAAPATNKAAFTYTAKSGDTLWGLAEKYLGDGARWKELGKSIGVTTDAQARKMPAGVKVKIPANSKATSSETTRKSAARNTMTQKKSSKAKSGGSTKQSRAADKARMARRVSAMKVSVSSIANAYN